MSESPTPALPESLRGPDLPLHLVRRFWVLLVIAGLALGSFGWWFLGAFNDQHYAPVQPIAYSHKLHAGDLHIDCGYCHFNAERGKHAGVPPMSVCMGCHSQVKTGSPEIKKLADIVEKGSYVGDDGVVNEGGVVHWARVHKLPDHVYFSHQWHVKAGVACQTCHGPVETMEVVRQFAPLTMGWCLDCHRNTNYVGGPHYDPKQPATFTVGTANYDVVRARQQPDPVVVFHDREVKPSSAAKAAASSGPELPAVEPAQSPADATYARLLHDHPDLPRWRIRDLPESHRAYYGKLYEHDDQGKPILELSRTFMNAPTQCSTCHQ